MRAVTLIYCLRVDYILLGMKKRGFGVGKLNGYGGKVHDDELIEQAAVRELKEEAKLDANLSDLEKVAIIDFYFADVPKEQNWDQTVHAYILNKWIGEPQETEEMKPEWYHKNDVLSDNLLKKMWIDDSYWLPKVLDGKKLRASFTFGEQGKTIKEYGIDYVIEL